MAGVARIWPRAGLWRHGDFLRLWSAETISQVGSQVSNLALPLVAILILHASAFEVALLATLVFLPWLLFSLPAGVWVDRLRRRPILVAADLGRAALLASIPIAYALDGLTLWQLYAVTFAVGTLTVFFDVAYQSYLPSLVSREQLVEGNSKLEVSRSAAQIAGPGLAGTLVDLATAPAAILVDALSFLASALFLFRIRRPEERVVRDGERPRGMLPELGEGLRFVFRNPLLRAMAASTAMFNFFNSVMGAVVIVYFVRRLDLSPAVIGFVLTAGNVGFLAGALLTSRVSRWLGVGPAIVLGSAGGIAIVLIPFAPENDPIPFLLAAEVGATFGVAIYNILAVSLRQGLAPARIQGRMNAVMRFLVWGVIPLGTLSGGGLASWFDLKTAVWVGAVGNAFAFVPLLLSPLRSRRAAPEPDLDTLPAAVPQPAVSAVER
jgi:MFS family permease